MHACVAGYADRCRALSIELTHASRRARVVGDPERLAQVVDNLLSNALRYTDPGGQVAVALELRDGEAVVEVADSGIGIAPGELERIFDRFWRSPEARARTADGSGVGLARRLRPRARARRPRRGRERARPRDARSRWPSRSTRDVAGALARGPAATAVPERWRRRADVGAAQPDAPVAAVARERRRPHGHSAIRLDEAGRLPENSLCRKTGIPSPPGAVA